MTKNTILSLALLTMSYGFAQDMTPKEVKKYMSQGSQSGIEISIPEATTDDVEDAIKEVTKKYKGKKRSLKKTDEYLLDDCTIESISTNTIDLYNFIEKTSTGCKYTAYFDLGGAYLDSTYNAEKYNYAAMIVKEIAMKAHEINYEDIIKDENKALDKLADKKDKAIKDNERAAKEIQEAKDSITKNEALIEDNKKLIEVTTEDIGAQQKKIGELEIKKKIYNK